MPTKQQSFTLLAGPDLDARIAERVMGWFVRIDYDYRPPQIEWQDRHGVKALVNSPDQMEGLRMWSPSTDIAAAMLVADRFDTFEAQRPTLFGEPEYKVDLSLGEDKIGTGIADTLALAICRAALECVDYVPPVHPHAPGGFLI